MRRLLPLVGAVLVLASVLSSTATADTFRVVQPHPSAVGSVGATMIPFTSTQPGSGGTSFAALRPIWQAAGNAYGIPWEVLGAINKVETNFGQNLEHRRVLEIRTGTHGDRLDAWTTSRVQLFTSYGLGKRRAHEVIDDLTVYLFAVLLTDYGQRRFAGTKSLEPRSARDLVQPLSHFAVDLGGGNRHLEPAFKSAGGGQRNLHIHSLQS
jgi:hypothetical protein